MKNYYSIHLDTESTFDRKSKQCLGKLRATNSERDQYVLYDAEDKNFRKEHGAFKFKYEMCNVGNIRKMKVILPNLEVVEESKELLFKQIPCEPID